MNFRHLRGCDTITGMIESETDVGNQSLGLDQAANDGIHTKILFIIYGVKGNGTSLCNKSF